MPSLWIFENKQKPVSSAAAMSSRLRSLNLPWIEELDRTRLRGWKEFRVPNLWWLSSYPRSSINRSRAHTVVYSYFPGNIKSRDFGYLSISLSAISCDKLWITSSQRSAISLKDDWELVFEQHPLSKHPDQASNQP